MNKFMLSMAFAALIGGSASAQATKPQETHATDRGERITERMTERLKLTKDQVPKVQEINDRYAKEFAALHQEHKEAKAEGEAHAPGADRDKGREINAKKNEELKGVLTPEQMTEWNKMQQEMMDKMRERRQEKRATDKK